MWSASPGNGGSYFWKKRNTQFINSTWDIHDTYDIYYTYDKYDTYDIYVFYKDKETIPLFSKLIFLHFLIKYVIIYH